MGLFSKSCLGIDFGATSLKVVELSKFGRKRKLKNYAQFSIPLKDKFSPIFFKKENLLLSAELSSEVLNYLLKKANIKEKKATIALPDFSIFFTKFELPPMPEKEVPEAVEFEARHRIPLSLSEVTYDWQIIEKREMPPATKVKILLAALPHQVLISYQKLATLTELRILGMEAEVFALSHLSKLLFPELESFCLVDIGWESTTVSIAKDKRLFLSESFDIADKQFTENISEKLKISMEKANSLKKKYGLDPKEKDLFQALSEKVRLLGAEINGVCETFFQEEGIRIETVLLAGGVCSMFGLKDYLSAHLGKEVLLINPFSILSFPSLLRERLKQLAPSFAVAVGAGLLGLES